MRFLRGADVVIVFLLYPLQERRLAALRQTLIEFFRSAGFGDPLARSGWRIQKSLSALCVAIGATRRQTHSMTSGISSNTALTGLRAATRTLSNSAHQTANATTPGFRAGATALDEAPGVRR